MNNLKDVFVSAVVINNNTNNIINTLSVIQDTLINNYTHYEILIVDTENSNNSFIEEMNGILKIMPKIRYIRLFNHPAKEVQFAAGVENAIGDIILTAIPEFFTPTNIVNAVDLCYSGNDITFGVQSNNLQKDLINNNVNFICASRRIVNASASLNIFHDYLFYALYSTSKKYTTINLNTKNDKVSFIKTAYNKFNLKLATSKNMTNIALNTFIKSIITFIICLIGSITCSILFTSNMLLLIPISVFAFFMIVLSSIAFSVNLILINKLLKYTVNPYTVIFEKHSSVMLDYNALNIKNISIAELSNQTQTGRDR